jgi:TnsA endonuclease N terminal/TnsA endonuclease C terminal
MGRWRPLVTKESIRRRIGEGYGQGEGGDYKPWIVVQSFSSLGRVHRLKGWMSGRIHHLLSDNERKVFLSYQWSRRVIDIREQYPLFPIEETWEIAKSLGVRHAADRCTRCPIPMTTDLLLTIHETNRYRFHPRSVKYLKDLSDQRTLEKLEIERRYWGTSPRNLRLKVVSGESISDAFVRNMLWFSPCYRLTDLFPLTELDVNRITYALTSVVTSQTLPIKTVAQECDRGLGLEFGTSLLVVRHLLAIRYWEVDAKVRIRTSEPLVLMNRPVGNVYERTRSVA